MTTRSLPEFPRLGTSSFSSSDWVGPFYPDGTPPSRTVEGWARFLARLTERRVPSFVYINNHYAGHAPATLEKLKQLFLDASQGDEP